MKSNNLSKSVQATMSAFEDKVKTLSAVNTIEDKLASLTTHIDKQVEIPIEYIKIEDNVRRTLDTSSEKFQELVQSIKSQGLLQNLVVDLRFNNEVHELYCIAGQRRLLAAREAGKVKANCLIKQFDNPADRIASGLAENLTREDLHCIDIAEGFAGLISNGWNHEQVAEHFERNPRTVRRYLTIASWPAEAIAIIRENLEIFTTKLIFNELVSHKYESNDQLIEMIKSKVQKQQVKRPKFISPKSTNLKQIEKDIKEKGKLTLKVRGNEEVGKITITYNNQDELLRIKDLLIQGN